MTSEMDVFYRSTKINATNLHNTQPHANNKYTRNYFICILPILAEWKCFYKKFLKMHILTGFSFFVLVNCIQSEK